MVGLDELVERADDWGARHLAHGREVLGEGRENACVHDRILKNGIPMNVRDSRRRRA